jgi:uncharacterized protein YgbK (DUF1537 family)
VTELCILADDLTGAADAGALFAAHDLQVTLLLEPSVAADSPPSLDVGVLTTESRALAAPVAYERALHAVRVGARLGAEHFLVKLDSTLRGNLGAPIDAVLDHGGGRAAVVCPAFPELGRTVLGGRLLIDGVPVSSTAMGIDPVTPVTDSHIARLLRRQTDRRVDAVRLPAVEAGSDRLTRDLRALIAGGATIVVVDAVETRHLDTIVQAAERCEDIVLCGSAGIAGSLAAACGQRRSPSLQPRADPGPTLAVVGSLHPASRSQAGELSSRSGWQTVALDRRGTSAGAEDWPVERERLLDELSLGQPSGVLVTVDAALSDERVPGAHRLITARLADLAARVAQVAQPTKLILTGGETAHAVMTRCGVDRLDVLGEVAPGIPQSRARTPCGLDWVIVTKAGGFGDPGTLAALATYLHDESGAT